MIAPNQCPRYLGFGDCDGRGAFTHTSYNDFEIVAANLLDNYFYSEDYEDDEMAMLDHPSHGHSMQQNSNNINNASWTNGSFYAVGGPPLAAETVSPNDDDAPMEPRMMGRGRGAPIPAWMEGHGRGI